MTRGKRLAPDLRGQVEALLITGNTASYVATQTGGPYRTVAHIAAQLRDRIAEAGTDYQRLTHDYLVEAMNAQIDMLATLSDGAWLRQQNARQLGTLLGVLADKSFRLLAALEPATGDGDGRDTGAHQGARPATSAGP